MNYLHSTLSYQISVIMYANGVKKPLLVKKRYYEISMLAEKEVLMKTIA